MMAVRARRVWSTTKGALSSRLLMLRAALLGRRVLVIECRPGKRGPWDEHVAVVRVGLEARHLRVAAAVLADLEARALGAAKRELFREAVREEIDHLCAEAERPAI